MGLIRWVTLPRASLLLSAQSIANYIYTGVLRQVLIQKICMEYKCLGLPRTFLMYLRWWLAELVSGVCKGGLVFRICPSGRHVRLTPILLLHKELVRGGVVSYPIPGSAPAKVNHILWYLGLLTKFDICPYTALSEYFSSEMFSYTIELTRNSVTCTNGHLYLMCENILSRGHAYWIHPLNTGIIMIYTPHACTRGKVIGCVYQS